MNLNPSNLGANFSVGAGFLFAEFSCSFFSSLESWKLELQVKLEEAEAEAATTEAAKSPDFFMVDDKLKQFDPKNYGEAERK